MNMLKKSQAVLIMLCAVMMLFGCGKQIEDFESYAKTIEEISVPEPAKIIALGEATHGNAEFQQLKLDVLKTLVEKDQVRAFALEGDFGGCAVVNDYILTGKGTAREAVSAIGFQIYRTQQMVDLVEWMRSYNETAAEEDKLRFYGFDMQRVENSSKRLVNLLETSGTSVMADLSVQLTALYGENVDGASADIILQRQVALNDVKRELETNKDSYLSAWTAEDYTYAVHYADCLLQCASLSEADGYSYNTIRDEYMAANVDWILQMEQQLSHQRIMISGHNGHVARKGSSYTNMGSILYEKYSGEYTVIGTDFYQTNCNIANSKDRGNYRFCSKDPLAKQLKQMGKEMCYVDFAGVPDTSLLGKVIQSPMKMGSLGESYAWYMKLLSKSYIINQTPVELYDGMIFVYEATPTEVFELTE